MVELDSGQADRRGCSAIDCDQALALNVQSFRVERLMRSTEMYSIVTIRRRPASGSKNEKENKIYKK
jgi:hypothetical protein